MGVRRFFEPLPDQMSGRAELLAGGLDPASVKIGLVEGARLESNFGDAYRLTFKHLVAQSIQRLPARVCFSTWTRQRRHLSDAWGRPYTVSTQLPDSLDRVRPVCGAVRP